MATPDAGVVVFGSKEWEEKNAAEVAARPQVLPMNQRHMWTPAELDSVRAYMANGMSRQKAIELALGEKK